MIILTAPGGYQRATWQQILNRIATALQAAFMKGQDMELARGERLILRSPDGTRWAIAVSDTGTISATSL